MDAGKSKVMVGSSGGKMIVNSGKWPYGVCGKEYMQPLFSAQYVKYGFTSGAVVTYHGFSAVGYVTGQSRKLI